MKLRQEQIVFLVAFLVLGFMSYRLVTGEAKKRGSRRGGEKAELVRYPAPEVAVALPAGGTPLSVQREFMAPPSDTQPLPPLVLVEPPRAPLASLFPPPVPGPGPRKFGALLRRDFGLEVDPDEVAELFADVDTGLGDVDYDDFELFQERPDSAPSLRDLLEEAGGARTESDPEDDLTAQERALLVESWKREYDWYFDQIKTRFGRIENANRYGLKTDPGRASEPLLFTELNPRDSTEVFKGMPPIEVPRDKVASFDFAGTVANRIEVRRLELGDELERSTYDEALALAADCVRDRLEAPRALPIAEEIYRKCAAFDAADPAPRLGLARCFEAGFDFEKAFQEYNSLLESFGHRAEVHARLGALEARFFLLEQAEERLRHAVSVDRSSWEARWTLGRFLLEQGEFEEAAEHLEQANRNVPNDPETFEERVAIRTDFASARLGAGDVAEAHSLFARALSVAPDHQVARAGWIATEVLKPADAGFNGSVEEPDAADEDTVGFELLLARGLQAIAEGEVAVAMDQLNAAAEADPLRANLAWRALSYLSELAGFPDEAQRYIEQALGCDPTDAWSLYQQGRLFVQQEDFEGARAAFLAALEQELDFEDALASLGEMAFRLGDFQEADRFLERAVSLEPNRVEVQALRGLNFLRLEQVAGARDCFAAGRAIERDDPICQAGLAWCRYLSGESEQAMVSLRELDDSMRDLPEDTPERVWAREQIERITDHEEKVEWSDTFERKQIRNDWDFREDAGPVHTIVDDEVVLEGVFNKTGNTVLYRTMAASVFVSIEADVWIDPTTNANVGLFLARERKRSASTDTIARAAVLRHSDGSLQINIERQGQTPIVTDMEQPFPTGTWVRLRIERSGDATNSRVTLFADGIPLVENAPMASLRAATPIILGLVAEGEPGRPVKVKLDNVKVVYREAR